jgi:hypothetical protein
MYLWLGKVTVPTALGSSSKWVLPDSKFRQAKAKSKPIKSALENNAGT